MYLPLLASYFHTQDVVCGSQTQSNLKIAFSLTTCSNSLADRIPMQPKCIFSVFTTGLLCGQTAECSQITRKKNFLNPGENSP